MSVILNFQSVVNWINAHLITCPFKYHTGLDCPGCGLQRSFIALLQGDVAGSFKLYPATIPILALFVFVPLHLKFDFKQGAYFIKFAYTGIAIIIVLNYIYKIYTHQLN